MSKAKEISALYKDIKQQMGRLVSLCHDVESRAEAAERVRKETYYEGFHNGHSICFENTKDLIEERKNEAYQRGLNDAWEAARKIALNKEDGGLDTEAYCETFGYGKGIGAVLKTFSASKAIEKIRQYEEKQEEIQVGDEVIATSGKAVIVDVNDDKDKARYIYPDSTLGFDNICNLSKTGRHFPEIVEVLQKMKET